MDREHVRPEKADVAQELRVAHSVPRCGLLDLEMRLGHVGRDQRMLLVGQYPRSAQTLLVDSPDHAGRDADLYSATQSVMASDQRARIASATSGSSISAAGTSNS